jgi:putative pyruvate formate lyase activating enzyme
MGCVFCQNYQISAGHAGHMGRTTDKAEFARICLALQEKGAENINIVTGSHAVPAIAEGIADARNRGLNIPVLWNSSGYELPSTLELLKETVDVFLPDMKTLDSGIAKRFFNAPDYPAVAAAAIEKMLKMRQLHFKGSILVSGVMVRHLVLPGQLKATHEVLHWFANRCAGQALLSLMFQFTPIYHGTAPSCTEEKARFIHKLKAVRQDSFPPWLFSNFSDNTINSPGFAIPDKLSDRHITEQEYDMVLDWLAEFGIEDGYCQELVPGNVDWLPDFTKENPFPADLSVPVWHWRSGWIA